MARPKGDFHLSRFKLLQVIKSLAGLQACFAGNIYLGKRINKCPKQVGRYLKSLKEEGLVVVLTSKAKFDPKLGRMYKKRSIYPSYNYVTMPHPKVEDPSDFVPMQPDAEELMFKATLEIIQKEQSLRQQVIQEAFALEDFDRAAVIREMQAELAAQGVQMEI